MEAELNHCQTETCKATNENVEDQESVVTEEAATPEKKEQKGTEESINQSEGEEARSDEQKEAATTEKHEQEKTEENINRSEGEEARSDEQKEAETTEKREQERTEENINRSECEEARSDEQKEAATPEKYEQERTEESEVVRSSKPKTDNEGDIKPEESQTSSINPENHEEETACIQPAGADVVDDTKKEQQSTKSTTDSGVTECGAQANSTTKTDAKKASDKRSADPPRSTTMPKSYGRSSKKDIAEKFGGVATSGVKVKRSTSCGAGAVKNMLLEWCRAKTRGREGVDIQNFSSSWSNGLAFCALIVAFFPDAFDYDSLDPKNRRHNFQLAFTTAEERADCPPLLDIEDMVRMKVPDSKCVYTYVQELYRSLVAKGLVKTKKA